MSSAQSVLQRSHRLKRSCIFSCMFWKHGDFYRLSCCTPCNEWLCSPASRGLILELVWCMHTLAMAGGHGSTAATLPAAPRCGLRNSCSAAACECWGAGAGTTWCVVGRLCQPPGHFSLRMSHWILVAPAEAPWGWEGWWHQPSLQRAVYGEQD